MEKIDITKEICSKGGQHSLLYDKTHHLIECKKCHKTWLSKEYYPESHKPNSDSSRKSSTEG